MGEPWDIDIDGWFWEQRRERLAAAELDRRKDPDLYAVDLPDTRCESMQAPEMMCQLERGHDGPHGHRGPFATLSVWGLALTRETPKGSTEPGR